jgi:hypothetical protein
MDNFGSRFGGSYESNINILNGAMLAKHICRAGKLPTAFCNFISVTSFSLRGMLGKRYLLFNLIRSYIYIE